jgi:UDP-GlcNAc:undecaprenyl-phosphate/decaprenyl-phosphate GlcNAc-1-phosphate transferase
MTPVYFFLALVVAGSLVTNSLLLKFVRSLGTKNQAEKVQIRWSQQTISFFIFFLCSVVAAILIGEVGNISRSVLAGLVGSGCLAFAAGLFDDSYNTKPLTKLAAQIACGLILVFSGVVLSLTGIGMLDKVITVLWVVGMMNSLNMLDNMDGVSAFCALIIFIWLGISFSSLGGGVNVLTIVCFGMAATLAGFLFFNWHPSKLFMGDSGSLLIGNLLAAMSVVLMMKGQTLDFSGPSTISQLVMIGTAFIAPLSDTVTVTINRLLVGRSPALGGRDHTTHHLSYLGLKDGVIALIYGILTAFGCAFAYGSFFELHAIDFFSKRMALAYIALVFLTLFIISRINLKRKKFTY